MLQPGDLPTSFQQFDVGAQVNVDNSGTVRADTSRDGREGGWKSRYHRAGSPKTRGPLVVESRADLFKGSSGAKKDLALYGTLFGSRGGAHDASVPQIGQATVASVAPGPGGVLATKIYAIAWRDGNVSASVVVDGFAKRVSIADAVALARKQEQHIATMLKR